MLRTHHLCLYSNTQRKNSRRLCDPISDHSQAIWACFHYGLAPRQVVWKVVEESSLRQPTWTVWLVDGFGPETDNLKISTVQNASIEVFAAAQLKTPCFWNTTHWVPTVRGDVVAGARNVILLGHLYPWMWGRYVGIRKIKIRLPILAASSSRSTKS